MTPEILPEQLARERLEAKQEALDDVEMLLGLYLKTCAEVGASPATDEVKRCIGLVKTVRAELPRRPKKP